MSFSNGSLLNSQVSIAKLNIGDPSEQWLMLLRFIVDVMFAAVAMSISAVKWCLKIILRLSSTLSISCCRPPSANEDSHIDSDADLQMESALVRFLQKEVQRCQRTVTVENATIIRKRYRWRRLLKTLPVCEAQYSLAERFANVCAKLCLQRYLEQLFRQACVVVRWWSLTVRIHINKSKKFFAYSEESAESICRGASQQTCFMWEDQKAHATRELIHVWAINLKKQ